MKRYTYKRKPRKCPNCGSSKIAPIMYGLPVSDPEFWSDVDAGNIVLGGCCVTDDDPAWCCTKCEAHMYRKKIGSNDRYH